MTAFPSQQREVRLPRSVRCRRRNFKIVGIFNVGMYEYDLEFCFYAVGLSQIFLVMVTVFLVRNLCGQTGTD